jgi:hypothetical protein
MGLNWSSSWLLKGNQCEREGIHLIPILTSEGNKLIDYTLYSSLEKGETNSSRHIIKNQLIDPMANESADWSAD